MSYKQGETNWYSNPAFDKYRHLQFRKPWIPGGGSLLAEAGAIMSLLPPAPCRVLDAGCADGYLTNILSLCGYNATGIDVCSRVIQDISFRTVTWNGFDSSAKFYEVDFDNVQGSCDVIIFASALHHSVNQKETLKTAYSILNPGGMLIASEPGLFHSSGRGTQQWVKDFDVTERSTPPYRLVRLGKKIGFRKFKVYPNPVSLHKSVYEQEGFRERHPIVVQATKLFGAILPQAAKWFHGLTVMYKERK